MTVAQIMEKMIAFSEGNIHDIDHLIRVWTYAKTIGELEEVDSETRFTIEVAAITHDIACPLCREKYGNTFDVVFMEGGILHYFHDPDEFMRMMNSLLKAGGKMICSDFHPFTKIKDILKFETPSMSYFSTEVFEGEMAHARFYDEKIRSRMPKCSYRKYTISEIINAIIRNGFCLKQFDEHPSWEDDGLPGEFTAVAIKQQSVG